MSILFAYAHHLCAFVLFSAVLIELILLWQNFDLRIAKTLRLVDAIYGFAAGAIVVLGIVRVVYFEKGAEYYLHSSPFIIKMILFAIVGLFSIYPTVVFLSWGKDIQQGRLPQLNEEKRRRIINILYVEMLALIFIILHAVLLAKGFYY